MMTRALANAARWIPVTSTGMTTFVAWHDNSADVIPALVAGIQPSANALDQWRPHTGQRRIEVYPMGVGFFDQIDLPSPRPFLHSLLALDGFSHISELLEPDEAVDLVFAGEAGAFCGFVLLHTKDKAVSDPDIEGTPRFAGENINPIAAHNTPQDLPTEYEARWIAGTSPAMTSAAREAS